MYTCANTLLRMNTDCVVNCVVHFSSLWDSKKTWKVYNSCSRDKYEACRTIKAHIRVHEHAVLRRDL